MSELPPIVRFTPRAEELGRRELPDHERGNIISNATSMNSGDQIVYPRDDPAQNVVFYVLSIQGRFVDLGVPEEWSEADAGQGAPRLS